MIFLRIPLKPVAKGRPRFTRLGRAYTPDQTRNYEREVAKWAKHNYSGKPLSGPLQVAIVFCFVRPVSQGSPKSKKFRERPNCKPDLENLSKSVCDALNGILWVDDSEICRLQLSKIYGDAEFTQLLVEPLDLS